MSTHAMNSQLSFHDVHFLHNLPPVYSSKGLIERTATNIFRKAVYGAKWQNFAAGIGTGATYVSLHGLHWHPHWLTIVEMILFLINVAIFCVNLTLILINVSMQLRKGMYSQIIQPSTPLFAPLVVLDYGTICVGVFLYAQEFGATDMNRSQGLFWSYLAFSTIICTSMTFMWFGSGEQRKLQSFAMTGAFLVFPLMLVGTIAFNTLRVIDPSLTSALAIWVLGYIFQGLGMAVTFIFITIHFYRAIRYGFHRGAAANSTFIAAGPPGFTALSILQLGSYGRKILPLHTPLPQEGADVIYYASIPVALCLLGFALYCWVFAMLPYTLTLSKHVMLNPAAAWPLMFPAAGFISTLSTFGSIFDSHAFYYTHAVFTGYVCLVFVVLLPTWLYRLLVPPDPNILAARKQYFEDAYDHVNFWTTVRMADEAEDKFH
ncbi:hypothetical protein PILCRDRAFT_819605 [Piloderma croceum F 1598]|uniref:Uncharacterized protein n=1 Tax=Piloderma croceum (strain F 1598) TaxID=765440 RepID=A0A0C3BAP7_PILCF|nr:hypothetical protein PILCRDRAFT_819605 [Piloderma croceum F 1598]